METDINMKKEEFIRFLLEEIEKLKQRVESLEREKSRASAVLERIWNNEYDAIWDEV